METANSDRVECQSYFRPRELDHRQHPDQSPLLPLAVPAEATASANSPPVAARVALDCIECDGDIAESDTHCIYCGTSIDVTLAQFSRPVEVETVSDSVVPTVVPASASQTKQDPKTETPELDGLENL